MTTLKHDRPSWDSGYPAACEVPEAHETDVFYADECDGCQIAFAAAIANDSTAMFRDAGTGELMTMREAAIRAVADDTLDSRRKAWIVQALERAS